MHARAKAALTDVVDPAIFDVPDGHVPKHFNGSISVPASSTASINTASQPWNSKVTAQIRACAVLRQLLPVAWDWQGKLS